MTDPQAIQARACAQDITTISAVLAIKKPPVVKPGVKTFELKPP